MIRHLPGWTAAADQQQFFHQAKGFLKTSVFGSFSWRAASCGRTANTGAVAPGGADDEIDVIVAHASPENIWSSVDSAIAVTYLELAAQADGLGTCWSGILVRAAGQDKRITEYLGLPPENKIFGAVTIGYPKFRYHRIPEKNPAVIDWL